MERVAVHNSGKLREATLNGKKYIVARATLIVPGVLSGSQGALYYPPEEVAQNVDAWNGMPLVLGHPTNNGAHVSARSPEVVERFGLGYVFNAQIRKGRLVAETWFDVAQTERNAPQVLNKLRKGQPVELSTGLFTVNHPAGKGAVYNGKAYQYVARSYRPDHLAILVDQPGACSLKDGCGVLAGNESCESCAVENKKGKSGDGRWVTTDDDVRLFVEGGVLKTKPGGKSIDKGVKSKSVDDKLKGFEERSKKRAESREVKKTISDKDWDDAVAGLEKSREAYRQARKAGKKGEAKSRLNDARKYRKILLGNASTKSRADQLLTLNLSGAKACEIARDGTVHGKKLTKKQKGLFGAKCSESKENNMTGNCGGKGGKPGPCPSGKSEKKKSNRAKSKNVRPQIGDRMQFDGKASDGSIEGSFPVYVIDDHSNKDKVTHSKDGEDYEGSSKHIPTALVRRPAHVFMGKIRESKEFHAPHYTLKTIDPTANNSTGDTSMTKKDKMVRFLTANCECWKGKDDAKTLAALPDDKLKALVDNAKRAKEAAEVVGNLLSTLSEDAEQPITANELPTIVANMKGAMKKGAFANTPAEEEESASEEMAESDMEEQKEMHKPAFMKNAKKKGKYGMSLNQERDEERSAPTLNEWLESAPPEVRSVIANAQRIEQKQKLEIVAELVGNSRAKTKADKEALHKFLMAKPLDELQTLNQLAPAPRKVEPTTNAMPGLSGYMTERMPDYSGLGEVEEFTANAGDEDDTTLEDAPLAIPTVNWAEEAKLTLPGRERK